MSAAHHTALLALHYQNDVLHADGLIRVGVEANSPQRQALIEAAGRLLAQARAQGVPIVHVRVGYRPDYADLLCNAPILHNVKRIGAMQTGSWGAQFFDGLAPLPNEFEVHHTRINAFFGSALEPVVRRLGVERLVIAGVATHSVVESTVRHAVDMGYEVAVVASACGAPPATHEASLASMSLIAQIDRDEDWAAVFGAPQAQ
ncbi:MULTISPECIES: cysteine hydrolase family protein [Alcaligenes]|jgi:nicotinamidase-related amidase|uniref:Isochorismatase n=1 Tax=Alcaligenes faecalis TaxID=511 RepID=A0AB33CRF6_ALCFA|nr:MULTISPECIES: cysteine hydrolase [Alcaligenes]ASR89130.1 isochorismatase [Alcaligenes faecalis]AWG34098.1 isochorismatase [Alcaligenes aquatilis]QXR37223.1 cysteine hydrolase [Alcaligenes aquatilis]